VSTSSDSKATAAMNGSASASVESLGLDPAHRQVAELIRQAEVFACTHDSTEARAWSDQLIQSIIHHVDAERPDLARVPAGRRHSLLDGQDPAPGAAVDLMAIFVRQADAERNSLAAALASSVTNESSEFVTDWVIAQSDPIDPSALTDRPRARDTYSALASAQNPSA
jgi:hypothetical protein